MKLPSIQISVFYILPLLLLISVLAYFAVRPYKKSSDNSPAAVYSSGIPLTPAMLDNPVIQMIENAFAQQEWHYQTYPEDDNHTAHFILKLTGEKEKMTVHVVVDIDSDQYVINAVPDNIDPLDESQIPSALITMNSFNNKSCCAFLALTDRGKLIVTCGVNTDDKAYSTESFLVNLSAVTTAVDTETSRIYNPNSNN